MLKPISFPIDNPNFYIVSFNGEVVNKFLGELELEQGWFIENGWDDIPNLCSYINIEIISVPLEFKITKESEEIQTILSEDFVENPGYIGKRPRSRKH